MLDKTVDEMDAELLALGDDVYAGVFLLLDPDERCIALCLFKLCTFQFPGRPKLFRLGQP